MNLSRLSITQELKNLENEKELMTSAIAEINENQHLNTQQIHDGYSKLETQLGEAKQVNESSTK